jgi:hypothetical protein
LSCQSAAVTVDAVPLPRRREELPWARGAGEVLARADAAIAPSRNRTGSLSSGSSDSQANGRGSPSASRHSVSRLVLPEPTGAWTRASVAPAAARSSATRRVRGTSPGQTRGTRIFVVVRTAPDAAARTGVKGSETMLSAVRPRDRVEPTLYKPGEGQRRSAPPARRAVSLRRCAVPRR